MLPASPSTASRLSAPRIGGPSATSDIAGFRTRMAAAEVQSLDKAPRAKRAKLAEELMIATNRVNELKGGCGRGEENLGGDGLPDPCVRLCITSAG